MEGIPNYEISKPFTDETFRLIDDDNYVNESDRDENKFKSENGEFDFRFHLWWRNTISCRLKRKR